MILEKEQIQRYLRHILIPEISGPGQKKLLDSRVFIHCSDLSESAFLLYYLVAMGIGKIHCQAENLDGNEFIKEHLKSLNPYVDLCLSESTHKLRLEYPMDFDAAIISSNKHGLNLDAQALNIPAVFTAAAGDRGYLRTTEKGEKLSVIIEEIKDFYKDIKDETACFFFEKASHSLLGVLAAIETVKILLNIGNPCKSPLRFDLAANSFTYGQNLPASEPYKLDYAKVSKLLKEAKVLIVGAGGLGSPTAYTLASMGVGKIGLVDYDSVELSNLNRQILHSTDKIGMAKVKSAEEFLKKLNPDIEICPYEQKFTIDNAEQLVKNYDIIIDGLDNLPTRYLLNDACFFMKKPMIEAGVLGFNGLAAAIMPGVGPCYRCIFPESSDDSPIPSCSETGVLGAVPGVMGLLEAVEAVKHLTGIGRTLVNKMLQFDAMQLEFTLIDIYRDPHCDLCGSNPKFDTLKEYEFVCKSKIQ